MADSLESVNVAARLYRRWIEDALKTPPTISRAGNIARWTGVAEGLEAAAAELERLRVWSKPVPASYGDLSDLPAELLAQLSGAKTDPLEEQIHAIVKAAGDEIELDMVLIELFRRHGEIHQRRFITNKAYRMAQKGVIHIVPGRKGVYSIHPQEKRVVEDGDFGGYSSAPKPTAKETFSADLDDEIPF